MPKELQLQILGEFRGIPQQVMSTELEEFGKLERAGRILHRFRIGDYRVYFEKHELGVVVHRILNRHTLKDFLFRSGLKMDEDEALQQNPKFWEMIEAAKTDRDIRSVWLLTSATSGDVFAEFHVPIRQINEVLPTVVLIEAEVDLHEGTPFRAFRFSYEVQTCFLRCAVRFERVALDARANDVFPRRRSAAVSRDDVVEVQIFPVKNIAAILAGVFIALKNVVPGELDFLFRHAIEHHEQNDAGHPDAERDGFDRFGMRLAQ